MSASGSPSATEDTVMTTDTSPFHPAELAIQERFGRRKMLATPARRFIRDYLVEQHRDFFQQLPFVVVGSGDPLGQPWASIVAGEPGFAHSPDPHHLDIRAAVSSDDPLAANLAVGSPVDR